MVVRIERLIPILEGLDKWCALKNAHEKGFTFKTLESVMGSIIKTDSNSKIKEYVEQLKELDILYLKNINGYWLYTLNKERVEMCLKQAGSD